MTCIVLHFSHENAANYPVAGIPAAARAVHQVALAADEGQQVGRCVVAVPGGWAPSQWCRAELTRLAPHLDVQLADWDGIRTAAGMLHISGEELIPARTIAGLQLQPSPPPTVTTDAAPSLEGMLRNLRLKGDAIIAATVKPGDGIVSRHFNRPISRLISRTLLRFPGVRPFHATMAAAILGIAMAGCLFAGGKQGLVIGAVLFQLASIVDGVDGEMARATYRSSHRGAMLDSMTDAATNLSFFAGVSFNLWSRGQHLPAAAGATGLVLLSVGLLLIGRQARRTQGPFTFDAVKEHLAANPSRLKQWLTWLTMRDFYAAAAAIAVIGGFASQMLVLFAAAVAVWLAVSMTVLARPAGSSNAARLLSGTSADASGSSGPPPPPSRS